MSTIDEAIAALRRRLDQQDRRLALYERLQARLEADHRYAELSLEVACRQAADLREQLDRRLSEVRDAAALLALTSSSPSAR